MSSVGYKQAISPAEIFSSCTSGEGQDYHWLGQKYQGSKVNRWTMRQPQLTHPKVNTKVTWPTWFLTGVTTPFCLQSMASGTDCRLPRWPIPLRVAEQSWNRKIPIVVNKQLYDCVPLHTWGPITYLGCHYIPGVPWGRSPWIPQIPCQQNNSVPLWKQKPLHFTWQLKDSSPYPVFLLAQNLSSKRIAPTDNVRPKLHDKYTRHQWLKG